jgi:hypothetical protein
VGDAADDGEGRQREGPGAFGVHHRDPDAPTTGATTVSHPNNTASATTAP